MPTIVGQTPTPGSALRPTDPIAFQVQDIGAPFLLGINYADGGTEYIWDGAVFSPFYLQKSVAETISGGTQNFTIYRAGGWKVAPTIVVPIGVPGGSVSATADTKAHLKSTIDPSVGACLVAATDGSGGMHVWVPGDTTPDDGGTILASSFPSAPSGRWRRIYSGPLDVRWFGCVEGTGDDATKAAANVVAINAAIVAANAFAHATEIAAPGGASVLLPPGVVGINASIVVLPGVTLRGAGKTATTLRMIAAADPTRILKSTSPVNSSTNVQIHIEDMTIVDVAGNARDHWQASHTFSVGAVVTPANPRSNVLLKCLTNSSPTGAHEPFGVLTRVSGPGGVVTITGTPVATYVGVDVQITTAGTPGDSIGEFAWSTDGGSTYDASRPFLSTSPVALGSTGLFAAFSNTSYGFGDQHSSPIYRWSLVVGTVISDGGHTWEVLEASSGYCDVAGSQIYLTRVRICFAHICLILDQSEIVHVADCEFVTLATGAANVWLVNGDDHLQTGVGGGFTNDIFFTGCNFQGGALGIVDDGGAAHTITDGCQFPNQDHFLTICGIEGLNCSANYIEAVGIKASNKTYFGRYAVGAPVGLVFANNFISSDTFFDSTGVSTFDLSVIGNFFSVTVKVVAGVGSISGAYESGNFEFHSTPIFDAAPVYGETHSQNAVTIKAATISVVGNQGMHGVTIAQATRAGQLTDSTTGAPSSTIGDVGSSFSQSGLNDIHASLLAKINALELILHNKGITS
jgi:hypothetical protein